MNPCRAIARLLVVVGTLMLVSCIDGQEEYWLNADGSGRAEITYSLPAVAARLQGGQAGVEKTLAEFLKNTAAITTSSHRVSVHGDRLTVAVGIAFDSVLKLWKISGDGSMKPLPSAASGLTGDIKVDLIGRQVSASRIIPVAKALPGAALLPASKFATHRLSYTLHLPLAASVSNATRTTDQGRTLIWDFPLADAVRRPIVIRFQAPIPIPVKWLVAAISVLLAAVIAGAFWIRRRRMIGNGIGNQSGNPPDR